jgi:hypothetical protein
MVQSYFLPSIPHSRGSDWHSGFLSASTSRTCQPGVLISAGLTATVVIKDGAAPARCRQADGEN